MEALKEITEWKVDFRQPNHTYLFDGEKAVAYIQWHEGAPIYFNRPTKIDKRGRKFVKADINLFDQITKPSKSHLIEFAGSAGGTYYVDPDANTCTCPGYQFRGRCKHLEKVVDTVTN